MLAAVFLFLAMFVGFLGYAALVSIFDGWVISKLWLWFMTPIFGLHPLTVPQCIAVALVVNYLTHYLAKTTQDFKDSKDSKWSAISTVVLTPFLTGFMFLLMGLIVRHFI
jgi:hypothetical protein